MSMIQIFMPVIWTVLSVLAGLALYRSSESIVQVKVARITGSAAIAAIAFYGLFRATPSSLLERTGPGDIAVPAASLKLTQQRVVDALATCEKEAMSRCATAADQTQCRDALTSIHTRLASVQSDLNAYLASSTE